MALPGTVTARTREYRIDVPGFGTWRIAYDTAAKKWHLACNLRLKGERWEPVRTFDVEEAAAVVVGERKTGLGSWDKLGLGREMNFDLSKWKTEGSEGAQADAVEN